jgi:small subunit ribosomal protein S6
LKRYEGMFLFDSSAARDWSAIEHEVRRLCGRIGATLLVCVKFDERKLAYEVRRRKRGTYVLCYFDAPPERIRELERDAQLSELILRLLVLRRDLSEERLAELQAWPAENALQPLSGDGRRHEEGGERGRPGEHRERPAAPEYRERPAAPEPAGTPAEVPAEALTHEPGSADRHEP